MALKKSLFLLVVFSLCIRLISLAQEDKSYVILISLDGYRYDYTERHQPENIQKLISAGVKAEAMRSSFPSKTFPNHYSIATGMRPERHGLVNNSFYDPKKDAVYRISDRNMVQDPEWYAGTPIWVHAEQNGLVTASYFFVGTEAAVQGIQPTYFYNYDATVPNLTRIAQVFEWLQLPEPERPRLISMYFSDMDDIGHRYGPDNDEEIGKRLHRLDRELGALIEGLKSFDLDIHIILVSDHGMANVPKSNLIDLEILTAGIKGRIVNNGALAHIYLESPEQKDDIIKKLNQRPDAIKAVDVEEKGLYQNLDYFAGRIGDILILPELGHYLVWPADMIKYQNRSAMFKTEVFGEHGYDPSHEEMYGIFYAKGPKIKSEFQIPIFDNVHVYPLICQLLGLPIPEGIDGDKKVLEGILIEN